MTKANMLPQQNIQQKINKKLKPGLVAFYDLQPGHGMGPFSITQPCTQKVAKIAS